MLPPLTLIQDLAAPSGAPARHDLADVLFAIRELTKQPTDASDAALLALMQDKRLRLAPGSPPSHALPPEELVKHLIAQYLLRRDLSKYLPAVEQLRDEAPTASFRQMIDAHVQAAKRSTP
jgi:hypothetical protein